MDWNGVSNTGSREANDIGAVGSHGVAGLRVVLDSLRGSLGDTEDVGPLLDVLPEVLRVEGRVSAKIIRRCCASERGNLHCSMPELEFRALPCETWEGIPDQIALRAL